MQEYFDTRATLNCLAALFTVGALACAPEHGEEETSEGHPAVQANHSVVATVDVGYGTVTFHRLDSPDGATRIGVSETAPNRYGVTPFSRLAGSDSTHLELFRAISPNVEAPALLTALHPFEADALGRENHDVRDVSYDPTLSIDKSPAQCQAWVLADPPDNCGVRTWTNTRKYDWASGFASLPVGSNPNYATIRHVTLGVCNESDSTVYGRIGIDYGGNSNSDFTYWGWAILDKGVSWRWYDFREVRTCSSCNGNVCTIRYGCYEPSRYTVEGLSFNGKQYDLYTAEAYEPQCFDF